MKLNVCMWQQHNRLSSLDENDASDSTSLLQDLRNTDEDSFVGGEMLVTALFCILKLTDGMV